MSLKKITKFGMSLILLTAVVSCGDDDEPIDTSNKNPILKVTIEDNETLLFNERNTAGATFVDVPVSKLSGIPVKIEVLANPITRARINDVVFIHEDDEGDPISEWFIDKLDALEWDTTFTIDIKSEEYLYIITEDVEGRETMNGIELFLDQSGTNNSLEGIYSGNLNFSEDLTVDFDKAGAGGFEVTINNFMDPAETSNGTYQLNQNLDKYFLSFQAFGNNYVLRADTLNDNVISGFFGNPSDANDTSSYVFDDELFFRMTK